MEDTHRGEVKSSTELVGGGMLMVEGAKLASHLINRSQNMGDNSEVVTFRIGAQVW